MRRLRPTDTPESLRRRADELAKQLADRRKSNKGYLDTNAKLIEIRALQIKAECRDEKRKAS